MENSAWDEAVFCFEQAYKNEKNNKTKIYYALTRLAAISTKPETVSFIRNRLGIEAYPNRLNALINLDWFKDIDREYKSSFPVDKDKAAFTEYTSGSYDDNYVRVNAHVKAHGGDTAGKQTANSWKVYTWGITDEEGNKTDGWFDYDDKASYEALLKLDPKERRGWHDFNSVTLVIDNFADDGAYMVPFDGFSEGSIPAATKKYSRGAGVQTWYKYKAVYTEYLPEVKVIADWYKDMRPLMKLPAIIVERYANSADSLIDEVYGLIFGKEFEEAVKVLKSLDDTPVDIPSKLIKLLHLEEHLGEDGFSIQSAQIKGVVGGLLVARGGMEFVQSYQFTTDLSFLKANWENREFNTQIKDKLKTYSKAMDPLANGFLTIRNAYKMRAAKEDFVAGLDLLVAMYDSFLSDSNMPQDAKDKVEKDYGYIKGLVQSTRDAIKNGGTVDMLQGENNYLQTEFTEFTINMGTLFTPGALKIENLFELDGNKPKISTSKRNRPCITFTLPNDIVELKDKNGNVFKDIQIDIGDFADTLKEFYKNK
ncbi:hypothetical protein [Treponema phagedenis]|uniref:hypothetical protein n=1 Tax=Treponema phagedenis TaxID=162 RepID=UPI0011EC19A7|nr:hypothetical protein [Treponema phagedenis]TYT79206.1 hypothetical protein FS559_08895 [Treponema phagedenis]